MAAHVKTPLRLSASRTDRNVILDADGKYVGIAVNAEVAAFIVQAVNSHAALVEALNAAEHDISTSNGLHSVAEPTVHLIYDALALAKGEFQ